ncbi:MAG: L-seryl-tRNA(Sec) selenium transferase [Methylocystaceae bacterium]|nr:MAG: L-seryl-tRNA(Sec) selenium transferase [Methylocystaceae bacterium]
MSERKLRVLPSVDETLKAEPALAAIERHGRAPTLQAVRRALDEARSKLREGDEAPVAAEDIAGRAAALLEAESASTVRAVFNLTGTVIHTNLGRAILAEAAIEAATRAMREAIALEFDLETGKRGERDALIRDLLRELTGAEDATVVNNNAAAVLITLNTLAKGREAIVSRGELIEIGGAFRMPDIMARAGAKLREVGTTNRTHPKDYVEALGPRAGLVLKVHTSNYLVQGFVAEVKAAQLASIAHDAQVPLVNDLGSGTLIDLRRFGLAHEPTVAEAVADGADLVTFSGDKLLGSAQAGFIVGRKELVARINRNPLKRALRVDKIRLAAIEATLRLYRDPDRLAERLPTIRLLARERDDIRRSAETLLSVVASAVGAAFTVDVVDCVSQIGSGALPLASLPSAGLAIRPSEKRGAGRALSALSERLRGLAVPVVGRIENDALVLDLRCLENEDAFRTDLAALSGNDNAR